MNAKKLITSIIIIFAVALITLGVYFLFIQKQNINSGEITNVSPLYTPTPETTPSIDYKNDEYGFIFSLSNTWQGYSVITEKWQGLTLSQEQGQIAALEGPEIVLRNPKWTSADPYQDIPIMIFTLNQWDDLLNEKFSVGAAPIPPSELGRNSKYVFALPARYNYAFPSGWEEVQQIIDSHPLKAS
jgi:hypothetical protein